MAFHIFFLSPIITSKFWWVLYICMQNCFNNNRTRWFIEAVVQRCSVKKLLLEIWQNSQENNCARVSFLIKLRARSATLLKKRLWHRYFPVNILKFLTLLFHTEHLWWLLLDLVCFFAKILLHYKTTISNINRAGMTILFSNSSPKIHKSGIFGPKFRHFCFFLWNFANRQIWGCWFKYDNSFFFFNSSPKIVKYGIFGQKYPNKVFLAPNLSIFVSSPDFPIRQIRSSWFQIWQ